jgi:hypothetical protein
MVAKLEGGGKAAMQLPTGKYDLPASVRVLDGKNTGTFYLAVNLRELANSSETLKGNHQWRRLVLAVKISNPTNYELSDKNTSVVVILDLNSNVWDNVSADLAEKEIRTLFPLF